MPERALFIIATLLASLASIGCTHVPSVGVGPVQFDPNAAPYLTWSSKTVRYAREAVNVRRGPGVSFSALGALSSHQQVEMLEERAGWTRVRYGDHEGWVSSGFLIDTAQMRARQDDAAYVARATATERARLAAIQREKQAAAESKRRARAEAEDRARATADGKHEAAAHEQRAAQPATSVNPPPTPIVEAAATVPAPRLADVDVAGIGFVWGMSRPEAIERYTPRAKRVEETGAVWLRGKHSGDIETPLEWFKLTFCAERLCKIHHVVNDFDGDARVGDLLAVDLERRCGKPTRDEWIESRYGHQRVRLWETPTARITLTHQKTQAYANVDYEPIEVGPAIPAQTSAVLEAKAE